jgi:NADPH:quinone reductase-like Zn-dependent oxidoreductase
MNTPTTSAPPTRPHDRTMRAARIRTWGPPEVITVESVAVPDPDDGQVLVRVHAAGVGPWDALVRSGNSGLGQSLPLTLGAEISGVVEQVGPRTIGFAVGDAVFGTTNPSFVGGYAQYAVAAAQMLAPKPAELSDAEAVSIPVVAVTAWQMLFDRAKVREGQTVVVHGGAGNVGAYAVQLARASKLHVIATVRGDGAYVRALGADEVIDAGRADLGPKGLVDYAQRADVVIDTVGGGTQDALFALVKPGGIIVSCVGMPDAERAAQHDVRADFFIVDVNTAQLSRIADMVKGKQLRTAVGSILPLAEARAAHEMLAGGRPHKRGKIVLQTV